MKYIRVTMPDGSKWDIPANFVAHERALYYSMKEAPDKKNVIKVYKEEYKFTLSDNYELKDWLSNNMNWEDVEDKAIKVKDRRLTMEDFLEGIVNGEKEIIDKKEEK